MWLRIFISQPTKREEKRTKEYLRKVDISYFRIYEFIQLFWFFFLTDSNFSSLSWIFIDLEKSEYCHFKICSSYFIFFIFIGMIYVYYSRTRNIKRESFLFEKYFFIYLFCYPNFENTDFSSILNWFKNVNNHCFNNVRFLKPIDIQLFKGRYFKKALPLEPIRSYSLSVLFLLDLWLAKD